MDRDLETTLTKNVWELEQIVAQGRASNQTRLALLRAYSQQVDLTEAELGIDADKRSRLRVSLDSRDGVLLVHGSTGNPADMRGLEEVVYNMGFTVYTVRLPGHGVPDAVEDSSWDSCLTDLENRYRILASGCSRVFVVAFSFGATLALQLKQKPRPSGLVMLAPAIYPRLTFWQRVLSMVGIDKTRWMRKKLGWRGEVLLAMEAARKQDWWENTPIYVSMAKDDETVDPRGVKFLAKRAAEKRSQVNVYPDGGHMFIHGDRQQDLHDAVSKFIKSL